MSREEVIKNIYRSLRDSPFPRFPYVDHHKNTLILKTEDKKITVSFRIKIEERQKDS
jgi:hypothetical protein